MFPAPRYLVIAVACAAAIPAAAQARDCAGPLQAAADAVSNLPGNIPYQVPDQLQLYYDQATELIETDPAACLALVARMDALIAQYMQRGSRAMAAGNGAAAGAPRGRRRDVPEPEHAVDAAAIRADLEAEDAERLRWRIERAAGDEAEDLEAVGEYRDAARNYAGAMRAFAVARRSGTTELPEVETAVRQIETLTREFETIVVLNARDDVMHARLEDAVRRVTEARRALERAWQRYHQRKAIEADDHVSPLASGSVPLAPLVHDFLAPLGDAETRAAQARLRAAERALKQVRNKWDPHVHRKDWTFLDMRDGYKQAYKREYDGFADELAAFDATLQSYPPDRIAEFTRRRVALSERHERRLDAIFEQYVIR